MPKEHKNFQEFIAAFDDFATNRALTIRRFIKLESYSYSDLQKRVYQAANYLEAENIKAGDRVMIIGANSPEWVIVFLAAQILGIVCVNVDIASTDSTIQKFADITEPSHIFSSRDLSKVFTQKIKLISLENIVELTKDFDCKRPVCKLSGDEGTIIVFTSGTTADPKGVVLSQRNILSNLHAILDIFDINPTWQFLSVLPLSHMYELSIGCLLPLYTGGGVYYIPRVTPLAISKAMNEYHITVMASVPQLGNMMMQKIELTAEKEGISAKLNMGFKIAKYLPHRLRRVVFKQVHEKLGGKLDILALGGAAPDPEMARKWELMGVKMVQGYGLTETSPLIAGNVIPKRRLDSQGMILPNIDWKLSSVNAAVVASGFL